MPPINHQELATRAVAVSTPAPTSVPLPSEQSRGQVLSGSPACASAFRAACSTQPVGLGGRQENLEEAGGRRRLLQLGSASRHELPEDPESAVVHFQAEGARPPCASTSCTETLKAPHLHAEFARAPGRSRLARRP